MRFNSKKRSGRSVKAQAKINRAVFENLETRVFLSGTALSGYSTTVTDIQAAGAFPTTSAYVNGGINATSGPFQYQSFAVAEFDPSNSTVYPDFALTTSSGQSPSVSTSTSGGTIAHSTTIFYQFTWTNAAGETTGSTQASTTTSSTATNNSNSVTFTAPTPWPVGATGLNVYASTTTGTEKLQGSISSPGTSLTLGSISTTGGSVPTTNTASPANTPLTTPTSLSLQLVNNPSAFNSSTGATGNVASGSFDVYLLPTYTAPVGSNLVYQTATAAGLPLGLQGQGGLSGVTASNFLLGNFTAASNGLISVPLSLPTGTTSAAATLTADLQNNLPFELAIVPHTATSYAQFQGESEAITNSGSPTPANGVAADNALNESPQLSLTSNTVSETFTTPYTNISVNQNNVSNVAEIDVQRNGYAGDAATVSFTTANGSGVAGTDFGMSGVTTQVSGTLSFAAGQTEAVISVPTINTGGAPDKTFTVTLSAPTSASGATVSLAGTPTATVTIIGTTNEADNIGGAVYDNQGISGNKGFILGSSASSVQLVSPQVGTYAAVSGSVTNGTDQFSSQQYDVMTFNASALQQQQNVTGLTSLTLELDNYNSTEGQFTDGTAFPSPNPVHYGNFNVYLLNSSVTGTPTTGFAFEGQDPNSGGNFNQGTPILLGTASFSNQNTVNSPISPLGNTEGIQDTYTLELTNTTAINALKADLNATSTLSPGQIRLAITAGSSAFAADFANNNSGTGGNYGIQPYLWFNGTATAATLPAESFAVNYANINVNANEASNAAPYNVVAVDVARPGGATGYIGDTAVVSYSLSSSTLYTGPHTGTVTIQPNQTIGTILIPLNSSDASITSQQTFNITLTGATTSGDTNAPSVNTTASTITLIPTPANTQTVAADNNGAAEVGSASLFNGYAYLNGSVANGTGSFAFQGWQVIEFQPSAFVASGQQITTNVSATTPNPTTPTTSLASLSLGLGNYENQITAPGSNYGGPAGNFTIYLAGTDESAFEQSLPTNFNKAASAGGDPGVFNNTPDGIGGFTGTPGVTPLTATPGFVGSSTTDSAIPLGTFSFNTKLGLDYFTPSTAALTATYTVVDPIRGSVTETPLQFITDQINAGDNVRILAAPGNSAFHAYFWGSNTGSNSGGPNGPHLAVVDTVTNAKTSEAVSFGSPTYNVLDGNTTITVPVTRSLLNDSGTGLNDTLTVSYATADGNAFAGTNYTAESGSVTFAPGATTANITVPILSAADVGDKAFTITLSNPTTSDTAHTSYVAPVTGTNPVATVFITDSNENQATLTQYTSSVGDIGTNGPVTFGGSALNPAPPFNFSIFTGGREAALDFNDNTVINYNDPGEFSSLTGPITPTGANDGNGNPTYTPTNLVSGNNTSNGTPTNSAGTGYVVYTPTADGSIYTNSITALNEITLSFVNYYNSTPNEALNVYLVGDATSNILPGAQGTSKNPHFYDTTIHNITSTLGDGINGTGSANSNSTTATQFGSIYTLGTITNPSTQTAVNFDGYTTVPLTAFNATAQTALLNDLNTGTKFRIIVAPESSNTSGNADWIYGYQNANASYATATGTPLNFYIQPNLSFDVSYAYNTTANPLVVSSALPSYITPSANADYVWDPTTGNLTVTNGTLTFTADSATDTTDKEVNLTVNGPTAQVYLNSNQHLAGLKIQNGGYVQEVSLGAARTHGNHDTLVIGKLGATADPTFIVDAASKLDLTDNDLVVHTGSNDTTGETELGVVQALAATGRNVAPGGIFDGTWTGNGLTSSAAANADSSANAGYEQNILAVALNSDLFLGGPSGNNSAWTVGSFSEALQSTDILVKYTYNGDLNLEGAVNGDASTVFSSYYPIASGANDFAFGDLNGDGKVDGNDSTIFSSVFGNGTVGSGLPLL